MIKTLKNLKMAEMLKSLEKFLSHRDKIGYVAARNYRIIDNCLTEYKSFRNELIKKYGEPDKNDDGTESSTISLNVSSPEFKKFCEELEPLNNIEHTIDVMTVKYAEVIGILSGEEILSIDWMFED